MQSSMGSDLGSGRLEGQQNETVIIETNTDAISTDQNVEGIKL